MDRIWHWIIYKVWYAIKHKQPTNQQVVKKNATYLQMMKEQEMFLYKESPWN